MNKKLSVIDRAMVAIDDQPAEPTMQSSPSLSSEKKTSPGVMMQYMQQSSEVARQNSELEKENANLKSNLSSWDDADPVRQIDPSLIRPSKWANRHKDSYESQDFTALKFEIEDAGGNIQPIKVRPIPHTEPASFEIVFGHRRHQACLQLGLPVLAMVDSSIEDSKLFIEMDRENRRRADLSPYEQGMMYKTALDGKLFPSQNVMSKAVGTSQATISMSLAAASLPPEILKSFRSPIDIQTRFIPQLTQAFKKDPDSVIARANELFSRTAANRDQLTASDVVNLLTTGADSSRLTSRAIKKGKQIVAIFKESKLKITIDLDKSLFDSASIIELEKFILSRVLFPE